MTSPSLLREFVPARPYPLLNSHSYREGSATGELLDTPNPFGTIGSHSPERHRTPSPSNSTSNHHPHNFNFDKTPRQSISTSTPLSLYGLNINTTEDEDSHNAKLEERIQKLEEGLSAITTAYHTELNALRQEVGLLRGLVLQSVVPVTPQLQTSASPFQYSANSFTSQPNHEVSNRNHFDDERYIKDREREREASESPLLTLRSPSPPSLPFFPSSSTNSTIPIATSPQQARHKYLNPTKFSPNVIQSPSFSPSISTSFGLFNGSGGSSLFAERPTSAQSSQNQFSDESPSALTLPQISSSILPSSSSLSALGHANSPSSNALGLGGGVGIPGGRLGQGLGLGSLGNSTSIGGGGGGGRPTSANGYARSPNNVGSAFSNGSPVGGNGVTRKEVEEDRRRSTMGFGAVGSGESAVVGSRRPESMFDGSNHSNSNWDTHSVSSMPPSPLIGAGASTNPPGSLGGKWEALGVGADLFRSVVKYGLGPPTKIQTKAIPCVLRNQDIVAQAPSIQERIQSYIIPAIQLVTSLLDPSSHPPSLHSQPRGIQVVIVTATVDQAAQAQRLSVGLGGAMGIRTALCVGQGDLGQELSTLLKAPPHVLVGTPQKLLEVFTASIDRSSVGGAGAGGLNGLGREVKLLVVDECDQLLARNLSDYLVKLVRLLPPSGVGNSGLGVVNINAGNALGGSPIISRSPLLSTSSSFSSLPGAFENYHPSPSLNSSSSPTTTTIERQTAIFSCTVPQDVLNFAASLSLREPVRVLVRRESGGDTTAPSFRGLKQFYVYLAISTSSASGNGSLSRSVSGSGSKDRSSRREAKSSTSSSGLGGGGGEMGNQWKLEALADLCEDFNFTTAVIYCGSLESVEGVSYKLGTRGIEGLALHQEMGQAARQSIMSKFRSTPTINNSRAGMVKRVLVIHGALARSLNDVSAVGLVVNYDLPRVVEDYSSRIACVSASGYGRSGIVINIVTPGPDVDMLRNIEAHYRCTIKELPPTFSVNS